MVPTIFLVRGILTFLFLVLVLATLDLNSNLLIPAIILFILITDMFDTNILDYKEHKRYAMTPEYHLYDKIFDSLTYILILCLFRSIVSKQTYVLLWICVMIRIVGIIVFSQTHSRFWFIVFPDVFKELLLLDYVSRFSSTIDSNYWFFVIVTIILKTGYESIHHHFALKYIDQIKNTLT